jgi:hypothetical protein
MFIDTNTAFNVFTAVLITCPCALAFNKHLLGNVLRVLKQQFYLKKRI